MSLTSMLVTYMKTSSLETAINSESAYSAPYTLTTTGLNDVIIQKQPKRKKKQPSSHHEGSSRHSNPSLSSADKKSKQE
jgi:hypothetical protein